MKAIVYRNYGAPDVLRYEEVAKPAVADGDVLIKVRTASVNPRDAYFMRGSPYMIRIMTGIGKPEKPQLGTDVAGEVESVGRTVTEFSAGDEVCGACAGAFADYACGSEKGLVHKPANVSFEQAATVATAGLTALQGLRDDGRIQRGHKVLINGAAGGVGTFAVQLAKWFGAEVTGVSSARNIELLQSIGADHVVDYTRVDFTTSGQHYDLILDTVGNRPLSACRRALHRTGTFVMVGARPGRWVGPFARLVRVILLSPFVSQRMAVCMARESKADLTLLQQLVSAGQVRPVIDRTYALHQVPEAVRYLEGGHARGKVVVVVQ
jgi:NADPH:quinone reductase-like Zn-dependent oxidoreductase